MKQIEDVLGIQPKEPKQQPELPSEAQVSQQVDGISTFASQE